jgi:hypothetical protein
MVKIVHTTDLGPSFFERLAASCAMIGADPLDVCGVMMSESGVLARAHNPNGNASGLIQFMPPTLLGLGWTHGHEAFRKLSATEQLPFVDRYLRQYRGMLTSLERVYCAVFLPALLPKATTLDFILTAKSGPLGWAYGPNASLDANRDYKITLGELGAAVRRNCRGKRWEEVHARCTQARDGRASYPMPSLTAPDLGSVLGIQSALAKLGFDPGPLDGYGGPLTRDAVTRFQRSAGLVPDGIVGPVTRARLGAVLALTP